VNVWGYVAIVVLLVLFYLYARRARSRATSENELRTSRIEVGTEVMTTSGLYGVVTARNDDETVLLRIAPGVEVKWALAALRDAGSLSERYRQGLDDRGDDPGENSGDNSGENPGDGPGGGPVT